MAPARVDFYAFDCHGLVTLRGAVPAEQVAAAVAEIGRIWPGLSTPWKFPVLDLGGVFWDLLRNDSIVAFCQHACGPYFRLDHAFGLSSNGALTNLHGGPDSSQGTCFYQWVGGDTALVGQLSVGVVLAPQNRETGGLCYIPGSHKAFSRIEGRKVFLDYLGGDFNHPAVIVPTLHPGDVVIFTESLIHGDTGWRAAEYSRLNIYYKFSPGWLAWRDPAQQAKYLPLARNDFERRLLEPAWSGRYGDDNHWMDVTNLRREETLHE